MDYPLQVCKWQVRELDDNLPCHRCTFHPSPVIPAIACAGNADLGQGLFAADVCGFGELIHRLEYLRNQGLAGEHLVAESMAVILPPACCSPDASNSAINLSILYAIMRNSMRHSCFCWVAMTYLAVGVPSMGMPTEPMLTSQELDQGRYSGMWVWPQKRVVLSRPFIRLAMASLLWWGKNPRYWERGEPWTKVALARPFPAISYW